MKAYPFFPQVAEENEFKLRELKETSEFFILLRIITSRWWVIISVLTICVASTWFFTSKQIPIYSASLTYVVAPAPDTLNGNGILNGLSVLGGQSTIANTYASIASSAFVKQQAGKAIGLSAETLKGLTVDSRVQTGTDIIEITVEGADPLLTQIFANRIGESAAEYISKISGVYDMTLLDSAVYPYTPIRPNLRLNLALGAALGTVLGFGLAFLLGLNRY